MKKISSVKGLSVIAFAFALPVITLAQQLPQQGGGDEGIKKLIGMLGGIVQALIPIVIGLGVLVFLWGVLKYVLNSSDAGKAEGRTFMLWGIIALFVMVSVWGLVNILRDSLELNTSTPTAPAIPKVQG
ncbi:MAG: hypothetical protein WC087_00445 [Candidatus Paceibacterota bacterium]